MSEDENKPESDKKSVVVPRETKFAEYEVPDQLKVWEGPDTYSKEYAEMMADLSALCDHIAKNLNEGPEVKDSVAKRVLTLRAVIKTIMMKTFCNNFNRVGLLEQMIFDIMYEQQMKIALAAYQRQMQAQAEQQRMRDKGIVE